VPWLSRAKDQNWLYDILTAQIEYYKPDVLLNNYIPLSSAYFRQMKPRFRLLVGLGLSMAHWIAKEHDGQIEVESEIAHGTIFRLVLPISAETRYP